jgi:hypothetical protein
MLLMRSLSILFMAISPAVVVHRWVLKSLAGYR